MRVFGNFKQFGKWSEPDPGFDGYILVEENGRFIGYQDELYGTVVGLEDLHTELNLVRYITGYIAESNKNGTRGIAFYKLSMQEDQSPIMYFCPDLTEEGVWAVPGVTGYFEPQGKARVSIEDVSATDGLVVGKINELHEQFANSDRLMIMELLGQVDACLDMLQNVE